MSTSKVMKLIDPSTGKMRCTVCGAEHFASIKPQSGGLYYRGSWQCVNRCKPPRRGERWDGEPVNVAIAPRPPCIPLIWRQETPRRCTASDHSCALVLRCTLKVWRLRDVQPPDRPALVQSGRRPGGDRGAARWHRLLDDHHVKLIPANVPQNATSSGDYYRSGQLEKSLCSLCCRALKLVRTLAPSCYRMPSMV